MGSFVLHGNIIDSESPERLRVAADSYLVCEEGRCTGVFSALPERFSGLPLTDFGDRLILPGMTDLHLHAPQFAFRGLGMDLELLDWLNARTFPEEAKYADLSYAALAYGQFVDCLRRSATTRAVVFGTVHPAATTLLMELLEASGLVSYVGKVNMDRDCPEALREADAAASLAATEQWLASARFAHTKPILTPRFVPSTTEKLMTGLGRLCETYDLPVQSHLSENRNEVAWVKELHPDLPSYTAVYDTFGLLRPEKTIMAHAIYLSDEEKRLLRDKGVYLAHCAQSNANLTSGIMPLRRNLENGLTCTIASDVAAGHTPAMNKQIALTIEISKLYSLKHDREKALTIGEGLYLATKGPGRFYGQTGSFEKGYAFDALVIHMDDIEGLERTPFEKLQQFIYDGDDRNIIARYVDGVSR